MNNDFHVSLNDVSFTMKIEARLLIKLLLLLFTVALSKKTKKKGKRSQQFREKKIRLLKSRILLNKKS